MVEVAGFEPAAFWSRTKDLVGFSAYFRFLPGFAANARFCRFFRLSPGISAYFQTIFKWTFGISQVQPSIATARVAA